MGMDKNGNSSTNRPNQNGSDKRGFSLPSTSSKPPMPPVKPPKKQGKWLLLFYHIGVYFLYNINDRR